MTSSPAEKDRVICLSLFAAGVGIDLNTVVWASLSLFTDHIGRPNFLGRGSKLATSRRSSGAVVA